MLEYIPVKTAEIHFTLFRCVGDLLLKSKIDVCCESLSGENVSGKTRTGQIGFSKITILSMNCKRSIEIARGTSSNEGTRTIANRIFVSYPRDDLTAAAVFAVPQTHNILCVTAIAKILLRTVGPKGGLGVFVII